MSTLDLPFHLPLTADEFDQMPPAEGLRIELWDGGVPDPRPRDQPGEYAAAGIPEFWLVEENPEDEADAVVNICRLSSVQQYELVRSVVLSALEKEFTA